MIHQFIFFAEFENSKLFYSDILSNTKIKHCDLNFIYDDKNMGYIPVTNDEFYSEPMVMFEASKLLKIGYVPKVMGKSKCTTFIVLTEICKNNSSELLNLVFIHITQQTDFMFCYSARIHLL